MVDIHCHILPGIDDGPETMEESLAMAASAIADGITHVVATPHSNHEFFFDFAHVRALSEDLRTRIGSRLELGTGCDLHVTTENLESLRADAASFTINQKYYLLLEFADFSIPTVMDQMLHEMRLAGLQPIITHPERNALLRGQPERLARWVKLGCAAQVTAGALTGGFGRGARRDAWRWIEQGLIHFVASDAHNLRGRPIALRPAYDLVRERCGESLAHALFVENPRAAWEGRPLPYFPELRDELARRRRKRFFFF